MRLRIIPVAIVFLSLSLAPAPGALAAPEVDDAGELAATAQVLTNQAVGSISGELSSGEDVDLYRICLAGGGSFSAGTAGGTEVDTELFLFDGTGLGVYANDDAVGTKQSLLPAHDPLTPAAPGEYLLGISAYDRDPHSASGSIFNNVAFLTGASGRGSGQPLEAWAGNTRSRGSYEIALTGVRSCETTAPTVDLRSPRDGDRVPLGARVEVDFSCADEGGSGLESCEGSLPDGSLLDTSVLGPRRLSVTAFDGAGNSSSASVGYEVVLLGDFGGFSWPARDFPAVGHWVAGLPLPMRFSVRDGHVADGYPQVAPVECGAAERPSSGERARGAFRRALRHRTSHGRHLFLWKTERAWAGGCRQFLLKLRHGSVERAEFRFGRGWPFHPGWGW